MCYAGIVYETITESPLESESTFPELPTVMADLQHAGHHFQTVSCELWKVSGPKVRIKKDCSVCFSVDTVVTGQDIVVGFDKSGIDIDSITSIQRKASNNTWIVTFDSPVSMTAALNEQSVTISGCVVFLGDCENKVTIVKLYELPTELPDSVIIGRLSHYGRVFSFRRDRIAEGIYNGVRTAQMVLDRPIPGQTFIAGEFARICTLASPKPAENVVQKGTLQPRVNPSAASTVNSLAIARTTLLCRPCVACAWPILTPPRSVLIFITTLMFFPLRFLPPVIFKLLREESKPRKSNNNKPRRNALNARRTRNASGRRKNARERRKSARRGNVRNARNKNERRENAKRKRKRTAERENVEITSVKRNKIEGSVTGRTDTIVEGRIRLTVGMNAGKKARKIVAAIATTIAQVTTVLPTVIAMPVAANLKMMVIVAGLKLHIARKAGIINLFLFNLPSSNLKSLPSMFVG